MTATRRLRKNERQEQILEALKAAPAVRVLDLAESLGVTTETIRRDIGELARQGKLYRTYGGAAARSLVFEPAITERERNRVEERKRIGDAAAALIEPAEVLMIDSGSTTTHFARSLAARDLELTVLTNRPAIAEILGQSPRVRVILCPGDFHPREGGVFGQETTDFLRRFNARTAVIGAGGLTPSGPNDADTNAAWIKRVMIERTERCILLVDHSKFGVPFLERVCPLNQLNWVVTDRQPGKELAGAVRDAGVKLRVAEEPRDRGQKSTAPPA